MIKRPELLIAIPVWLLAILYQSCREEDKMPNGPVRESSVSNNYLGDQACISCHINEYNLWKTSHHALAMLPANDTTIRGDFTNAILESKGIKSAFFRDGNKYVVRTEGPEGLVEDFKIKYTFGWTPLQQYLVEIPDGRGRLQALHLAWDTDQHKWFDLYPHDTIHSWDWMHWTNGAMTWNTMCADCHSTNLRKNYSAADDAYATTWSAINVSCEACHGPGQKHVDYVNSDGYGKKSPVRGAFMVQGYNIPPIQQIEQCARCHSRRTSVTPDYDHSGRFLDHYIPAILSDNLYHADGQILEENYVYGSFLQSNMFQNGVKCTDCHDPHSAQLKREENNLCLSCHSQSKYNNSDHHFHPLDTKSALCISCHMPGKYYMGNDFRRDHSFRVPRPDLSVNFNTPNACTGCHTGKPAEWAAEAVRNWYGPDRKPHFSDKLVRGASGSEKDLVALIEDPGEPGIVRATAAFYLGNFPDESAYQALAGSIHDRDALVRINAIIGLANHPVENRIRLLSPLLSDKIRAVRVTAANVLADAKISQLPLRYQEAFASARQECEDMLLHNADLNPGQFQLGQYYDRQGRDSLAIITYLKAIKQDSLFNRPRLNLARLYNKTGQNENAIRVLEDAITVDPDNPDAYYSLALVLAEEQKYNEAVTYFRESARINPENTRTYYNWGLVLHQDKKYKEAILVFKKGLLIDKGADDIRYALAIAYFESGNDKDALIEAERLLTKYPVKISLQNLVRNIRERKKNRKYQE